MVKEIWKVIPHTKEMYEVSTLGRIKSHKRKTKILKVSSSLGYQQISLMVEGKRNVKMVHRLVMDAFTSNPHKKKTVNHINGNKADNRVENLEWATMSENMKHAYDTGLRVVQYKKLSIKKVKEIIKLLSKGVAQSKIAKLFSIHKNTISSIATGRTWCKVTGLVPTRPSRAKVK